MQNSKTSLILLLTFISSVTYGAGSATDPQDCSIESVKKHMQTLKDVKVADDPAGAAFESSGDLSSEFKDFSDKNQCHLYVINLQKLMNGLLEGSNIPGQESQQKSQSQKYVMMEGKKARCAGVLGLKLPIEHFGVEASQ